MIVEFSPSLEVARISGYSSWSRAWSSAAAGQSASRPTTSDPQAASAGDRPQRSGHGDRVERPLSSELEPGRRGRQAIVDRDRPPERVRGRVGRAGRPGRRVCWRRRRGPRRELAPADRGRVTPRRPGREGRPGDQPDDRADGDEQRGAAGRHADQQDGPAAPAARRADGERPGAGRAGEDVVGTVGADRHRLEVPSCDAQSCGSSPQGRVIAMVRTGSPPCAAARPRRSRAAQDSGSTLGGARARGRQDDGQRRPAYPSPDRENGPNGPWHGRLA